MLSRTWATVIDKRSGVGFTSGRGLKTPKRAGAVMEARFSEAELIEVERYYDHRYWDSGTGPRHTFFRLIDYVRKTAVEPIKPFTPTATVPPVRPLPKRKKTTTWNGITRRKK